MLQLGMNSTPSTSWLYLPQHAPTHHCAPLPCACWGAHLVWAGRLLDALHHVVGELPHADHALVDGEHALPLPLPPIVPLQHPRQCSCSVPATHVLSVLPPAMPRMLAPEAMDEAPSCLAEVHSVRQCARKEEPAHIGGLVARGGHWVLLVGQQCGASRVVVHCRGAIAG